jgi:hypothetical protein
MSSQVTYTISTDETTQRREGTAWRQALAILTKYAASQRKR